MTVQTFFHLDCSAVIPECGYRCARCIQEIVAVVGSMPGVSSVSEGKRGEVSGILVQYDLDAVTLDRLMDAFRQLPSFYKGRFEPKVLDSPQNQSAV